MCPFSKNNHLARCLVSGVTDGRDNSRNNSARLCWRLLVQADPWCPRLRWAMVDHGSQLASSRRSLCQVQKLSYSCFFIGFRKHSKSLLAARPSVMFVCVTFRTQPSCSPSSFWVHGRQRQRRKVRPAMLVHNLFRTPGH